MSKIVISYEENGLKKSFVFVATAEEAPYIKAKEAFANYIKNSASYVVLNTTKEVLQNKLANSTREKEKIC